VASQTPSRLEAVKHTIGPVSAQPAPHPAPQPAAPAQQSRRPLPGRLRAWADVLLSPSVLTMRRLAQVGVITSAAIIWTGGAVRLSQSGLGCTSWPKCTTASLVAAGVHGDPLIHRWVEFGNRVVTLAIFVVAIAVFVAAWQFRDGGRRRRDLVWLAAAQPAGIVVQAVVGGIVVLTHLAPFWVSLHFIATLPVLAAAVALYIRCREGTGPARPLVQPLVRLVGLGLLIVTFVMMVAGTLVTGTGPLAGAKDTPRYHFLSLTAVTQLHADIGWVLGTLAVMMVLALTLTEAPARAVRLGWIVLGLIAAQGVIGYVQYFSHLPAGLVWVHVANTALIWIAVIGLYFSLRDRGHVGDPAPGTLADPALSTR
jgi:heme a synthase